MKRCNKCGVVRALAEFPRRGDHPERAASECKACRSSYQKAWQAQNREKCRGYGRRYYNDNKGKVREQHGRYRERNRAKYNMAHVTYMAKHRIPSKARRFGLTVEQYRQMLETQEGRCLLCRELPSGGRRYLCFDHCHATGRFRGLLCHLCNAMLGMARDRPEVLEAAAQYLRARESATA